MKPTKPLRRGLERDGAVVSSFPKLDLDHLLETLAARG